ncbi:hypothetical protein PVL29_019632 [Vitis rotundifolia]|uniref:Translation initiation factor eIF2B subunit epsilon n=1 Tax=Vitis rotundifolia TaxID=103349 RepID=A0AA38Z1H2_VITRO|nr:hypothetical protein PVL29_019632 [Vitis rotundifolia]
MVQRKGSTRVSEDAEELVRVPLQAILLADSFAQKFRPITLERPKVLLPLVNVPMIDYTLAWLESAGIEEVFVFCCAHSKQVINYLESSHWFSLPHFEVTTIESHNSVSAGDALRLIYERHVIHGDFVLITGDTVSNMSLTQALQEHKDRRKKDNNAVMTMVIKRSKPSPITHQSRLGTDELFMAIDPYTKQLLYYEDKADHLKGTLSLEKMLLADNPSISLHNDKQDCYIDICSPEVLSIFTDNFDYQHLRRHFIKGLLVDDIMGYKIFTHEIHSNYAARVDNFRSYDTISKDIIQRWTYPLVPDVQFLGNYIAKLERQGMYRASAITSPVDKLNGELTCKLPETEPWSTSEVGSGGVGYIWSICEGGHEEEWRHSVAPTSADKLTEVMQATDDDLELTTQGSNVLLPSGELVPDSNSNLSEDDDNEDSRDDSVYFEKEVEATFLRAVHENVKEDHVILEVNSLRLSYNMTSADCAGALFYSVMKLALETPCNSNSELLKNVASVITRWQKLLKSYLQSMDEEILHLLYEKDILQEDAILKWASEKEGAEESDKVFVKQSEKFIQWLNEASEEDD